MKKTVIESSQGQSAETHQSRLGRVARKAGKPLVAAVAAAGIGTAGGFGINAYRSHEHQQTMIVQKKLKSILNPTMVKIDQKFVDDHDKDPKRYRLTPLHDGTGRVQITDTGYEGTAFAVMGTDKSGNPDPQKPRFIEVGSTGVGTENVSAIWMGAPGGEDFAQDNNPPGTAGEGWQAAEDQNSPFPVYSTVDPGQVVAGTMQPTPTPEDQARGVINDWNQYYGQI